MNLGSSGSTAGGANRSFTNGAGVLMEYKIDSEGNYFWVSRHAAALGLSGSSARAYLGNTTSLDRAAGRIPEGYRYFVLQGGKLILKR